MVDDSTRFDGVALEEGGEVVTQFVLVEYEADAISQGDLIEIFEPLLASGTCTDPELASLRDQGFKLTYEYRGADGGYIGAISLAGVC